MEIRRDSEIIKVRQSITKIIKINECLCQKEKIKVLGVLINILKKFKKIWEMTKIIKTKLLNEI